MKLRLNTLILVTMAGQTSLGLAQERIAPLSPAQVIVTASRTDTDARREFIAGKIIIGRKRIEDSGVSTVEALLKREPAVTVSGNGHIGLLNLPGYTQVLVDGQQPMAGESPSQLNLVHVEKIEIIKSSVAEYGPYGIAGTINIVTRKTVRKTNTQLSTGVRSTGGKPGVNLTLSHNQSSEGSPIRFSARLAADEGTMPNESRIRQTRLIGGQYEQDQWQGLTRGESLSSSLSGSGNITWQRAADETLSMSPEIAKMRNPNTVNEFRQWADDSTLDVHQETRASLQWFSLPFKYMFKPSKKSQVEVNLRSRLMRMRTVVARAEASSDPDNSVRNMAQHANVQVNSGDLTYKTKLEGGHDIKAGTSFSHVKHDDDYGYMINGSPDIALAAFGTSRQSLSKQVRLYLQDEWRMNESWALNAGLSGQKTSIGIIESLYRGQVNFHLWSPSFHISKKIGKDDKRQLRLSLARSFKAPDADAYTVRPEINSLAPCSTLGICGSNAIETADKSGNLALKPERSLGVNLSYEHGIGNDSQITLEGYVRQISDKIGSDITLGSVPWSSSPRYVARPTNLGNASTAGINLEIELSLRDVSKSAPEVTLRGSAGLATSRVSSLPGPENRLDKQTPWTAKFGGSYSVAGLPLKFDIDADWSPSTWVRTSMAERILVARRFGLDTSANWTINKERRLVVSFKTRFPGTERESFEYITADERVRQYTEAKKYNVLSVQFETEL